jgi:hypothetical protein
VRSAAEPSAGCADYDIRVAKHCREPTAESNNKETNCDFFQPRAGAWVPKDRSAADRARDELEKLFGRK